MGDRVSAGAAAVGPPPATDADRGSARRRVPRPPRLLIVLVVLAVSVGAGVLLVSKLDDATNRSSASTQFFGGPSGPPISGVVSSPPAVDGGVTFTSDAAPNGYHRTNVEGLSVALPTEWFAMTPTSQAFQRLVRELNLPADSPVVTSTRLYAEDPLDLSVRFTIAEVPVLDASVLDQPDALAAGVRGAPGIVANSVKVSKLRIGGKPALRLDDAIVQQAPNGVRVTVYTQEYLIANAKGRLLQLTFSTGTDHTGDPKFAAVATSVHRVH